MATKHYENGIVGASEGGSTEIASDIFVTGAVYYVDSENGNDSNAGTNRNAPKSSLSSALSAATADNGDIIIIESGHAEDVPLGISISKAGLTIVGLGTGSTKPSFTVTGNVDMITLGAPRTHIYGLYFPEGSAAHTARINVNEVCCTIESCDFLCGANDLDSITLTASADYVRIKSCTFSVEADGPDSGILVESATLLGLEVDSCQFDGGSYDFDNAGLYSAFAHLNFLYKNNTLLNKASIIHTAAAKGRCFGTVAGDGSRVEV